MIVVLGSVTVQEGRIGEAIAASHVHVQRSRAEPGCISHAVHQDCENPNRLVFVEEWADQPALQAHFRVPASGAFVTSLAAMAVAPPRMTLYEAAPVRV